MTILTNDQLSTSLRLDCTMGSILHSALSSLIALSALYGVFLSPLNGQAKDMVSFVAAFGRTGNRIASTHIMLNVFMASKKASSATCKS